MEGNPSATPRSRRCHCGWGLVLLLLLSPSVALPQKLPYPLVFVQEPFTSEPVQNATGSRICVLHPDGRIVVLTQGFAAAADPCVSFDGQDILFAGRLQAGDPWEIWEMAADGSRKTRLTSAQGDSREPIYLAKAAVDAPDFRDKVRWITFVSTAPGVADERGTGPLTSLYAMNLGLVPGRGKVLWRTTYSLGGDLAPTALADGRVLFSAWQRQGFALMTISWAGEDLNAFYGTHDEFSQLSACELPDHTLVFVEREGEAGDRSGRLARVSFRRPLRTHQVLSQDSGRYRTPCGLPDSRLLVARTDGHNSYGLYLFDLEKGRPGTRIYDDPQWQDVDPQPLVSRPEPMGRIPMVEFASVLDVGGFKNAGQLQCLNVYESDRPEASQIHPGQVARVRLVSGVPVPLDQIQIRSDTSTGNSIWPPPFVQTLPLGEVPVEADGSFYVNVPGDMPFYIENLDAQGQVLMTMRAWAWVRSGDQRGCIGCHENKELAPENRATQALIRAQPPTLLFPAK